jgi:hypothetical protein
MADMKQRRWRSMMPITGAQSELTTREMVSGSRHHMCTVKCCACVNMHQYKKCEMLHD